MQSQRHIRPARVVITLLFSVVAITLTRNASAAESCDRACLGSMITQYVDALVARDPSKLPLADNLRYTEDSRAIKLGDGIWKTATAKGQFRQDYLDTRKQVAASHVVILEGQAQALYSVLLHMQGR